MRRRNAGSQSLISTADEALLTGALETAELSN